MVIVFTTVCVLFEIKSDNHLKINNKKKTLLKFLGRYIYKFHMHKLYTMHKDYICYFTLDLYIQADIHSKICKKRGRIIKKKIDYIFHSTLEKYNINSNKIEE